MGEKSEKAKELFKKGYSCSQAVLGAFCEEVNMDFDTAVSISSSFGAGMGRLREVCGAVSAVFMIAGLKYGYTSPDDKEGKIRHYKLVQDIAKCVSDKKGSIICRDLLGRRNEEKENYIPDERTKEYYSERPCLSMVEDLAKIAEEVLSGKF